MLSVVFCVLITAIPAVRQQPEPTVAKDALWITRVERGTMPLRVAATGSVSSILPPRATIPLSPEQLATVRTGQTCSIQLAGAKAISGRVGRVIPNDRQGTVAAEIELAQPLPKGTTIGTRVSGLIEVGTVNDVVYVERPDDSRPNTTASLFVVEADNEHAKRVAVKYGRQSGPLIEIVSGLSPGDRAIVSDMRAWAGYERVRMK